MFGTVQSYDRQEFGVVHNFGEPKHTGGDLEMPILMELFRQKIDHLKLDYDLHLIFPRIVSINKLENRS